VQSINDIAQATDRPYSRTRNQGGDAGISGWHDDSLCMNRIDQRKSANNRPNRPVEPELTEGA
jgi:hypothetical protein